MPSRFMVDREAMAGSTSHCTCRSVRRSGFLRSPALRGVLYFRADGLCVGQSIYHPRILRSSLDPSDGDPCHTRAQPLCEVDGGGSGRLALCTEPNRPGSAIQWNSSEYFGDRVHSWQECLVGTSL